MLPTTHDEEFLFNISAIKSCGGLENTNIRAIYLRSIVVRMSQHCQIYSSPFDWVYWQKNNISAGQKACNIIKVGVLGKPEILIPSLKGDRCWDILRISRNSLHVKNMEYALRTPGDARILKVTPEIHATTACGGRSISRLSSRGRNVRAWCFRSIVVRISQDCQINSGIPI